MLLFLDVDGEGEDNHVGGDGEAAVPMEAAEGHEHPESLESRKTHETRESHESIERCQSSKSSKFVSMICLKISQCRYTASNQDF